MSPQGVFRSSRHDADSRGAAFKELPCMGECIVRRQNRRLCRGRAAVRLHVYYDEEIYPVNDYSYIPANPSDIRPAFCLRTVNEGARRIIPVETRLIDLKQELEIFTGIPWQIQRLSYLDHSELIDDGKTLRQLRIVRNDSYLVLGVHDVWLPFIVPVMRFGVALVYPRKSLSVCEPRKISESTAAPLTPPKPKDPAVKHLSSTLQIQKQKSVLLRPPPGEHGLPQNEYKLSELKLTNQRSPFFDVFFVDSQSKVAFWIERRANTPLFFNNDPAALSKRANANNMRPMLVAALIEPLIGSRRCRVINDNSSNHPHYADQLNICPPLFGDTVTNAFGDHTHCRTPIDSIIRYCHSESTPDAKVALGGRILLRQLLQSPYPAYDVPEIVRQAVFLTNFYRRLAVNTVKKPVAKKVETAETAAKAAPLISTTVTDNVRTSNGEVERGSNKNEDEFRGSSTVRDSSVIENNAASQSISREQDALAARALPNKQRDLGAFKAEAKSKPGDNIGRSDKPPENSKLKEKPDDVRSPKITGRPKVQTMPPPVTNKLRPFVVSTHPPKAEYVSLRSTPQRERYSEYGNVDINSFLMDLDFFRGDQGQIYRPVYLVGRGPARRPPALRRIKPDDAATVPKSRVRHSKQLTETSAVLPLPGALTDVRKRPDKTVNATDAVIQMVTNEEFAINFNLQ